MRAAVFALSSAAASSATVPSRLLLEPLSASDWKAAGVGGTGCWWRHSGDRRWRFAMSDRTAAARVFDRLVVFEPLTGAPDAFPFTFDRWKAGSTTVDVVRIGRAAQTGVEVLRQTARIEMKADGRRIAYSGTLECGS